MKEYSVVCYGNANVDIIYYVPRIPKAEEEVEAETVEVFPGGSASNVAVAAAKLGLKARIVCCIGNDEWGNFILRNFASKRVDTSYVIRADKPTGRVIILVERGTGARAMVALRGANMELTSARVHAEQMKGLDHVHVSGGRLDMAEAALRLGKELGLSTSYDPGSVAVKYGYSKLAGVLKYVDVLLVNRREASALAETGAGSSLENLTCKVVVVKMGEEGSKAIMGGEEVYAQAFKLRQVVDTTGAGDVFDAGFILGFLKGLELSECLTLANAAAALKIERRGAQSAPTLEEVKRFLASRGRGRLANSL